MRKVFILMLGFFVCSYLGAQSSSTTQLSVQVQYDTVGLNEQFKITYLVKNANGINVETPDFTGFQLMMGPYTSSNISIINGVRSSSISYTYVLKPLTVGHHVIPSTTVYFDSESMQSPEVTVVIVEQTNRPPTMKQPSPFGDQSFRFDLGDSDTRMNELYKQQEELFKRHQDMFKDSPDFFNNPDQFLKDLPNSFGPGLLDLFKNLEDAFEFKLPPLERQKPKAPTYKL